MQATQDIAEKVLSHTAFEITKPFYFPYFFFFWKMLTSEPM